MSGLYNIQTKITDPEIGELFFNNVALEGEMDLGLLATARYFLTKRLEKDNFKIHVDHYIASEIKNDIAALGKRAEGFDKNTLNIIIVSGTDSLEVIKGFVKPPGRFILNKKLKTYFASTMANQVFINKTKKTTLIVIPRYDSGISGAIQAALPLLLPWIIKENEDKRPDLTTKEKNEFLKAIVEKDEEAYKKLIEDFVNEFDVREERIKILCSGIGKKIDKEQRSRIENSINAIKNNINFSFEQIRKEELELEQQQGKLYAIDARTSNIKDQDFVNLFLSIPEMDIVSIAENSIRFSVKTTTNVNPDGYDQVQLGLDNKNSVYYNGVAAEDIEDFRTLMKNIFSDAALLKIKTFSNIEIRITPGEGRPLKNFNSIQKENGYIRHPHIMRYNCFGTGQLPTKQFILDGDYISAIQQAMAVAQNVNQTETNIISDFMNSSNHDIDGVYKNTEKVLIAEDGTEFNYEEAVDWLQKQIQEH
ncbi:MAG: hypothetical protein RRZ64_06525 [Rikenellaceae bacterium]